MTLTKTSELTEFYRQVRQDSHLPTDQIARRWTRGVLQTLGLNLDRGAKSSLAKALPKELADAVNGVFWLLHFRNQSQSSFEFQKQVGSRSGNTDAQFARMPIVAVFKALKQIIDDNLRKRVADSLAPEIRDLWENA